MIPIFLTYVQSSPFYSRPHTYVNIAPFAILDDGSLGALTEFSFYDIVLCYNQLY